MRGKSSSPLGCRRLRSGSTRQRHCSTRACTRTRGSSRSIRTPWCVASDLNSHAADSGRRTRQTHPTPLSNTTADWGAPSHAPRPASLPTQPLVVFYGGHSFKLRAMPSALYLWRKHEFVARLQPAASVAPHIINTRGFLCVHYREHHARTDDRDLGANFFSRHSPLESFVARVARLPPNRPVYVASTSLEAKLALRQAHRGGRVTWSGDDSSIGAGEVRRSDSSFVSSPDGEEMRHRRGFIVDWFALAQCDAILGSYGSSFSDEAVHYRGTTKECVAARHVQADDVGYHALHTVVDGRRYVNGWARALADLYDEADPADIMETYRMVDPLRGL